MKREINYKTMRAVVGIIAILLAPLVHIFSGNLNGLTSISISYWTDSRDIFVGSLVAVGFFLFSYNGQGAERDSEFYLSKAACVFAICIALFPTTGFSAQDIPPKWTIHFSSLFGLKPQHIHYGSAILLFACLIMMMSFFF